ncbi:MAG: NUDIX hydrolase [Cytophagales bacterium]|nr:NUDIX hydrolase [Bernardetiaceae bacterium]MDW8203676.1 NUDIX hydrolase [Cytophagales bacterium]
MSSFSQTYGGSIRVRVGGICIENNRLLLVRLQNFGQLGYFWLPPGGGVQLGETLEAALQREFAEETGLQVTVERFLCANQVVVPPLHAIEFFFVVRILAGELRVGSDPELPPQQQMIDCVRWLTWEEIQQLPAGACHNLFQHSQNLTELLQLQGIYQLL